jgi:hypothetical protein
MAVARVDRVQTGSALACESQLRVAATTLSHALPGDISAITVVGVLGGDDRPRFNSLVGQISDELDLEAQIRLHVGSFSVRFSRRVDCD